jgi:hypothetical protein
MGYKYNGSPLSLDVAWKDTAGTQYPSNWLRGSTAAQRAAVPSGGVTWEAEPAWYDQEFYWGVDNPKAIAGLKTNWVQKQKDIANDLLAGTDWLVTRKAEIGTAVPSATTTYRAAVRTKCGEREATINACADTAALCATIRNTLSPTVAGTASNGATEKKKEDGSSYDPVQYNDIANPALLEDWPTAP